MLVFERKNNVKVPSRLGRVNRLALIDLLRYDVSQLVQLSHPRILHAQLQLVENKSHLISGNVIFRCALAS